MPKGGKSKYALLTEEQCLEVLAYYKEHTGAATLKKFKLPRSGFDKFLLANNVTPHTSTESEMLKHLALDGYSDWTDSQKFEVAEFYKTNSKSVTMAKFGIKKYWLVEILKQFNIPEHTYKEEQNLTATAAGHPPRLKIHINELSEEERKEYYANIRQKCMQTKLERYGDPNYNNREKCSQTNLERYGVVNTFQAECFKEKAEATKLDRYGDAHYTNRDQATQTNLERFGASTFLGSEAGKEAIMRYSRDTYGTDFAFLSDKWQAEAREIKKVTCPDNGLAKRTETMLERYGVEYFCITDACRDCGTGYKSRPNEHFAELLTAAGIPFEREFKVLRYSFDFKIGEILVEINPFPTHNSTWGPYNNTGVTPDYHSKKSQLAKEHGLQCIHVFDWVDQDKLINFLQPRTTVYARNCEIAELNKKTANSFLSEAHLQGPCRGNTVNLGLYHNEKLVQVMTFGKSRYSKKYDYELLRLCSLPGITVVGGASKLFSYFTNQLNPKSVLSYCDFSLFSGAVYDNLNFKLIRTNRIKHWYNSKTKEHYTDSYVQNNGFDRIFKTNYGKGVNNTELMRSHGFVEIYDAGQGVYLWQSAVS